MILRSNKGFTILELLIAVTLSIVIFIILFAALRLGYKSQAKGLERGEITQKIRILSDRLAWIIRGAYPYYFAKSDTQRIFFSGQSDRIGFVTTSVDTHGSGPEDRAGLKWISIYTDSDGLKIREKVFFLEDVFESSGGREYLLEPGVKKIEFEYFEIPEDEKQGSWISEWDPSDKKTIPYAVRLKITLEHDGKPVVIPEIIVRINAQRIVPGPGQPPI